MLVHLILRINTTRFLLHWYPVVHGFEFLQNSLHSGDIVTCAYQRWKKYEAFKDTMVANLYTSQEQVSAKDHLH